jgi:hypothetical protein
MIPHQLHLTQPQVVKLLKGGAVVVPHKNMGADKGEHIMMLSPQSARKLLTSYKNGKGMRVVLSPDEIHHCIKSGRGFRDTAKKLYDKGKAFVSSALDNPMIKVGAKQALKRGTEAVGTAIGAYFGNPEVGRQIGAFVGEAGGNAIDKKDINVAKYEIADKAKEVGLDYARREGRRRINRGVSDDAYRGLAHHALNVGANKVGATSGSDDLRRVGYGAKKGKLVKGSAEAKAYMASIRARKSGSGFGDDLLGGLKKVGRYVIPAATGGLAGIGATALTGNPLAGIAASAAGSYGGQKAVEKLGIEGAGARRRGRPRKVGGELNAVMSAPYKNAMRLNFGGLTRSAVVDNAPLTSFNQVNPKVRPSSTEMTMSPYARLDSPAMNPFIPAYYTQEGGSSCGYGGRGLYGSAGRGLY